MEYLNRFSFICIHLQLRIKLQKDYEINYLENKQKIITNSFWRNVKIFEVTKPNVKLNLNTKDYLLFSASAVQYKFNFVVIIRRRHWSNPVAIANPIFSGHQSNADMGCVAKIMSCNISTVPATPMSFPSESFFTRQLG